MYDTINVTLDTTGLDLVDFIYQHTGSSFENGSKDGQLYTRFKLENLTVSMKNNKIHIGNGSICKYLYGNNLVNFTRNDMKLAVEKLEDNLCVSLDNATVSKIDFAYNFDVSLPPESYYYHLGELPYYKRLEQMDGVIEGLYYNCKSGKKQLVFYNKLKEVQKNGEVIPNELYNHNVLRYEMRLKRWLNKSLGYDRIYLPMLYDEKFYSSLVDLYKDNYYNIRKENTYLLNFTDFTGYKGLKDIALLELIQENGGVVEFLRMIDNQYSGGFISKRDNSEIKRQVKVLLDSNRTAKIPNTAITELDKLVDSI